ncbi:MAG TPA: NAD(P)-binding protein, partial [Solirubrobacteraceae bacterium]|nr:NAD(P)-binding protein [Solirubrobacteraceae bacterium]
LAGLTAAIACAEGGARVVVHEAHDTLGGRARTSEGPYRANLGPHALYKDGPLWRWMAERRLLPEHVGPPLSGVRFRLQGQLRRTPPLSALPAVLRLRGRRAPVELSFREWAAEHTDERTAGMLSAAAGVYSFHHDPGALSAAFIWPRTVRLLLSPPPAARYPVGGWSAMVACMERRARELGVAIETGSAIGEPPAAPVIVATELERARELLGDDSLRWSSGSTLCLDLALERRRGDPFVVSDLDEAGWIERFSAHDRTLAPAGEELFQAQMPIRPGEDAERASRRLEALLDLSLPGWRERERWRRRQVMDGRSGAVDVPGTSWRDRPAVDRGEGVFLAGDMVAAPGLLSEVSWASAVEAARLAIAAAQSAAAAANGARDGALAAGGGAPAKLGGATLR